MSTKEEILSDPKKHIENYMLIQNKSREMVPFIFNPVQNHFHQAKKHRNIILKARQLGFSTYILANMLYEALTFPNTVCVCVSHEEKATRRLFARLKMMYDSLPREVKPPADHQSAFELTFPDLGSQIFIGTARAPVFGRGDTINVLHLSELAFYPTDKTAELMAAVTQAVPKDGTIYIESSPNGLGGMFYDLYQQAKDGIIYTPFFYPWWWDKEYALSEGSELVQEASRYKFEPIDIESQLMSKHHLCLDQIRWRRYKVDELEHLYHKDFREEYPEDDLTCWLVSGLTVFNTKALESMLTYAKDPIPSESDQYLSVWQRPRGDSKYIIGVDAALGLPTSDFTVATVLSIRDCNHVATLRGRLPVDIFTQKLADLGQKYNNAVIAVEREGHGESMLMMLRRLGYPHIYEYLDKRAGWPTTKTRSAMIDELSIAISSGYLTSHDKILLSEAIAFQFIDNKAQAPSNQHDDCLFAMMVSLMARNTQSILPRLYIPVQNYAEEVFV